MFRQTLAAAALIAGCSVYPSLAAETQTPAMPSATDAQKSGNPPGECEAVEQAGQQEKVEGKTDVSASSAGSDVKSAHEINKEIVTGMLDKKTSTGADSKSAKEVNKEIIENTKTTADGTKVAATGPAKPVENWFGCPPKKTQ